MDLQIKTIEEQLCDPEIFQNHEKVMILQTELETIKEQREEIELEWLELNEQLEEFV